MQSSQLPPSPVMPSRSTKPSSKPKPGRPPGSSLANVSTMSLASSTSSAALDPSSSSLAADLIADVFASWDSGKPTSNFTTFSAGSSTSLDLSPGNKPSASSSERPLDGDALSAATASRKLVRPALSQLEADDPSLPNSLLSPTSAVAPGRRHYPALSKVTPVAGYTPQPPPGSELEPQPGHTARAPSRASLWHNSEADHLSSSLATQGSLNSKEEVPTPRSHTPTAGRKSSASATGMAAQAATQSHSSRESSARTLSSNSSIACSADEAPKQTDPPKSVGGARNNANKTHDPTEFFQSFARSSIWNSEPIVGLMETPDLSLRIEGSKSNLRSELTESPLESPHGSCSFESLGNGHVSSGFSSPAPSDLYATSRSSTPRLPSTSMDNSRYVPPATYASSSAASAYGDSSYPPSLHESPVLQRTTTGQSSVSVYPESQSDRALGSRSASQTSLPAFLSTQLPISSSKSESRGSPLRKLSLSRKSNRSMASTSTSNPPSPTKHTAGLFAAPGSYPVNLSRSKSSVSLHRSKSEGGSKHAPSFEDAPPMPKMSLDAKRSFEWNDARSAGTQQMHQQPAYPQQQQQQMYQQPTYYPQQQYYPNVPRQPYPSPARVDPAVTSPPQYTGFPSTSTGSSHTSPQSRVGTFTTVPYVSAKSTPAATQIGAKRQVAVRQNQPRAEPVRMQLWTTPSRFGP
ncbi:uncharacterized protein BJ171DRAFT_566652 [Polychytrium aggregatum]|uniref:uncharacterized protein n=1 Tax=Polychytrium aggregatum TaxID=110093 RepID=UPI0022FE9B1A|nr:uncharacterized protein BJ171DRAFT_566652 [Polychytrium aggregatum]KAI9206290.1 hypothetical protein BJ171DRAFT_566652 [Polychytrium aggregatum]